MSDMIIPLTVMNASDDGEWTRVIWQASIGGQDTFIDSGFGPRLRSTFLRAAGVDGKQVPTLKGKVLHARVYRDDHNNFKVAPESIFSKNKDVPLTQQPFANLTDKVVTSVPKVLEKTVAITVVSSPNLKGGDTKSLKALAGACQHLLDRDGVNSRLENTSLVDKVAELQLSILKELNSRK